MNPKFEGYSEEYPGITFLYVDIDRRPVSSLLWELELDLYWPCECKSRILVRMRTLKMCLLFSSSTMVRGLIYILVPPKTLLKNALTNWTPAKPTCWSFLVFAFSLPCAIVWNKELFYGEHLPSCVWFLHWEQESICCYATALCFTRRMQWWAKRDIWGWVISSTSSLSLRA